MMVFNRRVFCGSLAAMIGLGASPELAEPATGSEKYESMIGLVRHGLCLSQAVVFVDQHGELKNPRRSSMTTFTYVESAFQSSLDDVAKMAKYHNALILPEQNGVEGAQLVRDFKRRCPERVLETPWNFLVNAGYQSALLRFNEWETGDRDMAVARAMALLGRNSIHF